MGLAQSMGSPAVTAGAGRGASSTKTKTNWEPAQP